MASGVIPGAVQSRMPNESKRRVRREDEITQLMLHTAVDAPGDHWLRFVFRNRGWSTTAYTNKHGVTEQYLDVHRRPTGSQKADDRAVTYETEDDGDPENIPLTSAQLQTLIRDWTWICREYQIPPRELVEDRRFGASDIRRFSLPGITWHSRPHWSGRWPGEGQWLDANKMFTSQRGKTCPGRTRARQLVEVIIPAIEANLAGVPIVQVHPALELKYGVSVLRLGDTGPAVVDLQMVLNKHGARLTVDSDFGAKTDGAVRAVQALLGVAVDGLWGVESARASYLSRKDRTNQTWPMLPGSRPVVVEVEPPPPPPPADPLDEIRTDVAAINVAVTEVEAKLAALR